MRNATQSSFRIFCTLAVLTFSAASASATLTFIDNGDAGFTAASLGTSGVATNGGVIDGNTYFDDGVGVVGTYSSTVSLAGTYDVWATWVSDVNRASDITYSITGGSSTVFDQESEPAADLLIPTPDFGSRIAGGGGGPVEDAPYELIGQVTLGAGGTLTVTVTNGGSAGAGAGAFADLDAIAFEIVTAPEPSTFFLAGLGMIGLGLCRRRRKRS